MLRVGTEMFTGFESPMHWLVVGVIALIVLGPKPLPEFGRSLGSGPRGFRDAISGHDEPHGPDAEAAASEPSPDPRTTEPSLSRASPPGSSTPHAIAAACASS